MRIFDKIINNPLTSTLIAALITFTISLAYQWYLRPRIIMDYSGLYSKVGEVTIGSVQVANLGRNVEEGMTVRIDTAINGADDVSVLINRVPVEEIVTVRPDFTDIVINELYPDDEALISFKPKDTSITGFEAYRFGRNMNTSRYEDLEWTAEWWQINETQRTALKIIIILGILIGMFTPRAKDFLLTRLSKEIRKRM